MNTIEVLYWEKEVKEMMDDIKKIYEKLSDKKALNNDIAGIKSEENKQYQNSNMNLEDSLAQIGKMRVVLETKTAEEKKAKLSRMQWEEESRNILRSLTYDEVSNALQNNSKEFIDLLSESEKINDGKKRSVREEKYEILEKDKSQSCIKPMKFIERNIQLAQSGNGVLSLTEKEKLRIQKLLRKDEEDWLSNDSGESLNDVFNKNSKHFYGFDDDSKLMLKRIDEQLEAFPKHIHLDTSESRQSSLEEEIEPQERKGNVNDNNDGDDLNKCKRRSKNETKSLKKIEKLLNDLNSVTNEEISPLGSEEMKLLIGQARQDLQDTVVKGSEERCKGNDAKELELYEKFKFMSCEHPVADLVLNAKCLMPKFKFRFDDV